jgi:hypothetical protein
MLFTYNAAVIIAATLYVLCSCAILPEPTVCVRYACVYTQTRARMLLPKPHITQLSSIEKCKTTAPEHLTCTDACAHCVYRLAARVYTAMLHMPSCCMFITEHKLLYRIVVMSYTPSNLCSTVYLI